VTVSDVVKKELMALTRHSSLMSLDKKNESRKISAKLTKTLNLQHSGMKRMHGFYITIER
jgi:hypothetical protein